MNNPVFRGRIILLALILMFALPAIIAKTVLSNHWYNSGVTNKGVLLHPKIDFDGLGLKNPYQNSQWQLGYFVPEQCDTLCIEQIHLLGQSHVALGKYQGRVAPVVWVSERSDKNVLQQHAFQVVMVNNEFSKVISPYDFVIVDPLGQLVMRYPKSASQQELVAQAKGLLSDLRKLLKLSRVG
ncbi:hypothetical protein AB2S62_16600 [Vibrio sp. NTOU-M3]|uniref:hypothetical protein n=1 Tax=Vibrio sp. NTOU-M3 TaxID=3234954 RepID=UPI00349F41F5